jgi:hypothetical protein
MTIHKQEQTGSSAYLERGSTFTDLKMKKTGSFNEKTRWNPIEWQGFFHVATSGWSREIRSATFWTHQ